MKKQIAKTLFGYLFLALFAIILLITAGCGKQTTMVSITGNPSVGQNVYDQWLVDTVYSIIMDQLKSSFPFSNDTFNLEIDKNLPMYPAFEYKLFKLLGRKNNSVNLVADPNATSSYDILKVDPLIFGIHTKKERQVFGLKIIETKILDVKLVFLRVRGGKIQRSLEAEAFATLRQKTFLHLFSSVYLNSYYGSSKDDSFDKEWPADETSEQ